MTLLLLTTGSINISTQTAKSKITNTVAENKTTLVFVHKLRADGSSCLKVMTILQEQGYNTIAVQNPTNSL